jgi:hypothetical protein
MRSPISHAHPASRQLRTLKGCGGLIHFHAHYSILGGFTVLRLVFEPLKQGISCRHGSLRQGYQYSLTAHSIRHYVSLIRKFKEHCAERTPMTATFEAGLRPLIPDDIARIVMSPKSYTDDNVIYPAFKWLRENMPLGVAEVEGYDPIWIVTKHADIRAVEVNAKLFHNADFNPILNDRASDAFMREINGGSTELIASLTYMDPRSMPPIGP